MTPTLLGPDDGDVIVDRTARTAIIKSGIDPLTLVWFRYEPGQHGPDPHVHRKHTDCFYVIEGEMTFELGQDVLRGGPGTFVMAPPGVRHTFRNESDGSGRFLNLHAPSCGFHDELRARRDGRRIAPFDQFDPPPDGGRPGSDGFFGPGGQAMEQIELREAEIGGDATAEDGGSTCAYWVLDGTLRVGSDGTEDLVAEAGSFVLAPPGAAHTVAGPARVVHVRA